MSLSDDSSPRRSLTPISSFGSSPERSTARTRDAEATPARAADPATAVAPPAAALSPAPSKKTTRTPRDPATLTPAARAAYVTRLRLKQVVSEYQATFPVVGAPQPPAARAASATHKRHHATAKLPVPPPPAAAVKTTPGASRPATAATAKTQASVPRQSSAKPKPASSLLFTPRSSARRRSRSPSASSSGNSGRAPIDPSVIPEAPPAPWTGPTDIPVYNSLRDPSLGHFFAKPATRQLLLRAGVIAEDGRIVQLNRAFGRVVVAERNFVLAEHDEQQRQDEAAFLKTKLQHRVATTRQQQQRVERVQLLRSADLRRLKARHEAQAELMRKCGVDVVREESGKPNDEPTKRDEEESKRVADDEVRSVHSASSRSRSSSPVRSVRSSSRSSSRSATPVKDQPAAVEQQEDDDYASDDFDSPVASPHVAPVLRAGGRYVFLRRDELHGGVQVFAPLVSDPSNVNGSLVAWRSTKVFESSTTLEWAIWEIDVHSGDSVTLSLNDVDLPQSYQGRPALCLGEARGTDLVLGALKDTPHFQFSQERHEVNDPLDVADAELSFLPRGRFEGSGVRLVNVKTLGALVASCQAYRLD